MIARATLLPLAGADLLDVISDVVWFKDTEGR